MSQDQPTRMSEEERRKVFWLLKKYSSYTAWEALAQAYYRFADAWMKAMRMADDADIDEFNQDATKSILTGRIGFEKGLARLKKGDRSVWRGNYSKSFAAWGPLKQAAHEVYFVEKIMNPVEYVFDWMKNKNEVLEAAQNISRERLGLGSVMERLTLGDSANWGSAFVFDPFWGPYNFPDQLPDVPPPTDITVHTGDEVPLDGIYEPEWGEPVRPEPGLWARMQAAMERRPSLFEPAPQPLVRGRHIGCMNYLVKHTVAPTYRDEERDKPWPVTWRLIWKDERYLDGTIPEEEGQYLAPVEPAAQAHPPSTPAGSPCPRTGWWFTPAKANSRRHFQTGQIMPDLHADWGLTIWQWDTREDD
ncbi:Imm72 family immunity protein [Caldimonas sp.]|uniref:Imm72 family immunity protein n=1 Tax=Caldimonas sp. TaxID=2838790 RepID=UPI00391C6246